MKTNKYEVEIWEQVSIWKRRKFDIETKDVLTKDNFENLLKEPMINSIVNFKEEDLAELEEEHLSWDKDSIEIKEV